MKLKPCPDCKSNINEYFRIQELRKKGKWTIGIAYCDYCGETIPFRSDAFDFEQFNEDAIKAWNTRQSEQ